MLLNENDKKDVLDFLKVRPIHTVIMTGFINDNGIESLHNRGKFYGFRNTSGQFDGVALIGHTTLIEARSDYAIAEFAQIARKSETPIHFMMSEGSIIEKFWEFYVDKSFKPRRICTEKLFKISSLPPSRNSSSLKLRQAVASELLPIAEAHALVAEAESGLNPLKIDRQGFLHRVLNRIEKRRTWVVFEDDKLLFKADIIAENSEVAYLEGIYVHPKLRGQGIATNCLNNLCEILLNKVKHICLLSNIEFINAHQAYLRAGFKIQETYQTIFV